MYTKKKNRRWKVFYRRGLKLSARVAQAPHQAQARTPFLLWSTAALSGSKTRTAFIDSTTSPRAEPMDAPCLFIIYSHPLVSSIGLPAKTSGRSHWTSAAPTARMAAQSRFWRYGGSSRNSLIRKLLDLRKADGAFKDDLFAVIDFNFHWLRHCLTNLLDISALIQRLRGCRLCIFHALRIHYWCFWSGTFVCSASESNIPFGIEI